MTVNNEIGRQLKGKIDKQTLEVTCYAYEAVNKLSKFAFQDYVINYNEHDDKCVEWNKKWNDTVSELGSIVADKLNHLFVSGKTDSKTALAYRLVDEWSNNYFPNIKTLEYVAYCAITRQHFDLSFIREMSSFFNFYMKNQLVFSDEKTLLETKNSYTKLESLPIEFFRDDNVQARTGKNYSLVHFYDDGLFGAGGAFSFSKNFIDEVDTQLNDSQFLDLLNVKIGVLHTLWKNAPKNHPSWNDETDAKHSDFTQSTFLLGESDMWNINWHNFY